MEMLWNRLKKVTHSYFNSKKSIQLSHIVLNTLDAVPKKKPITIEDQYAKDEHGRRRFHGAFTGGFSAGFCNTVGSLEGWQPSTFKSSRGSRAESKSQSVFDFMDAEVCIIS